MDIKGGTDWTHMWTTLVSHKECDIQIMHKAMMRAWDLKGDYDSIAVALAIQADMRKPKDKQRSTTETARRYVTTYYQLGGHGPKTSKDEQGE